MIDHATFSEAAEALDFPTNDSFAEQLWRMLSSGLLPYSEAAQIYRTCGYVPFCGFPLTRAGKIRRMSREQVEEALEHNPLILSWSHA